MVFTSCQEKLQTQGLLPLLLEELAETEQWLEIAIPAGLAFVESKNSDAEAVPVVVTITLEITKVSLLLVVSSSEVELLRELALALGEVRYCFFWL